MNSGSTASTALIPAPPEGPQLLAQIPLVREEIRRRAIPLAAIFATIALLALVIGFLIPKKYASSTTILVEESNIIAPLMEGRAVTTENKDLAGLSREVAFSRKVMHEILKVGGWMAADPSPVEQDRLIDRISARTDISNVAPSLIRITYTDSSPERAFDVTRRMGELVISESLAAKERESREAYEFINQRVEEYHRKLIEAERKLEDYRNANPDARPGVSVDVSSRIGELRRIVESERLNLIDQNAEVGALRAQVTGEARISEVQTPSTAIEGQLIALHAELRTLLLNYTDQHPDVIRVQHQIRDLEQMREDIERRQRQAPSRAGQLNASAELNPLYSELRSKLAQAERRSSATSSKIGSAEQMLGQEMERASSIGAAEGALAELTRDYEVNRDLYQDLLKRRENARVSMNLDAERKGLSFRIQEPAALPLRPQGLRMLYVALAGLLLAILIPAALLMGLLKVDSRVRSPRQIEQLAALPVLGVVPRYRTPAIRTTDSRRMRLAMLLALSVPILYTLALVLRWVQSQ